jgi:nucleoid-associated protein YgaU
MRSHWVRFLCLATLMFSLQFLNLGCSSSSSGEEGAEEVAATNEEEQAAAENNATENDAMANGEAGNNEQMANDAEGNALNNDGQVGAENNALANNNQGQQGGEEDLQQIIEEMNTANGQLPANNGGQGMNVGMNDGNAMANDGGMANAAMDPGMNAGANQASTALEAAPAAAAGGGVSGTPVGPGLPELGSKMSYMVQRGDTLGKIAARIYGDSNKWTEIANFTGLANPRLIYPGDVVYYQLTEQSMKFASTYESVKRSEVQIQQGDTLATIAGRVFGNSSLWKLIWRHNDMIDNPDRLTAGTTLFYVDPASMASNDSKTEQKFVKGKTKANSKVVTVSKVKASKTVLEVANDSLDDLFSQTVSKDFLKRT